MPKENNYEQSNHKAGIPEENYRAWYYRSALQESRECDGKEKYRENSAIHISLQ